MPAPNVYTLYFAVQTAQGTPADVPTLATVVRSSGVQPSKETAALEETGQGRDQPAPEVTRVSAGGDFQVYARSAIAGLLAYGAFGSTAATPPVDPATDSTHLSTPADDQPFLTVWRHMFGSSQHRLIERFMDCKVTQFQLEGEAGQPAMSLSSNLVGLLFERLPDMPALDPAGIFDRSLPIKFVDYEISLANTRNRSISSFTYNLQAGINTAQTDKLYDSYAEPGPRSLEVNYTQVFTDLADYNRTLYGGPTGTQPSAQEAHAPLLAKFKDGTGATRLTLDVPHFKYGTAPLEPNASAGEIARQQVTGAGDIPSNGDPVTTAEVVSEVSSYAAA